LIDLHSHILPAVDDGAATLEASLAIARMAVADGIEVMACTPHFMPGLYDNEASDIRGRVGNLNQVLADEGIPLALVTGSDAHIRPDFLQCLRDGRLLTLHDSRYVLFEPPHNIMPPRLEDLLFNISVSGYVPILTHPERLKWIEQSYASFQGMAKAGVWMQITSGSLTGRFGKRPQYWAQRMLSEGIVSILATDAHNVSSRPPLLSEGFEIAVSELGQEQAEHLVFTRPLGVLEDQDPGNLPALLEPVAPAKVSLWRRLVGVQS
jgi:protein-tyrosine phosphatase